MLESLLPSLGLLGVLAAVALVVSSTRRLTAGRDLLLRDAVRGAVVATILQGAHFVEELATGFPVRFPALFGRPAMPLSFFVAFNVAWLAIWGLAAWALGRRRGIALFPLWFLGLAEIANAVAHPIFSLLVGGYFPGLVTAPLVGLAGLRLWRSLVRVTE